MNKQIENIIEEIDRIENKISFKKDIEKENNKEIKRFNERIEELNFEKISLYIELDLLRMLEEK